MRTAPRLSAEAKLVSMHTAPRLLAEAKLAVCLPWAAE